MQAQAAESSGYAGQFRCCRDAPWVILRSSSIEQVKMVLANDRTSLRSMLACLQYKIGRFIFEGELKEFCILKEKQ
jgi:hypothetical protein